MIKRLHVQCKNTKSAFVFINCPIPSKDSVARVKQISIHRQLYRIYGTYDIKVYLKSNIETVYWQKTMSQDIHRIDNINSTMNLRIADDKKGDIYSAIILEIYKLGNWILLKTIEVIL